MLMLDSMNSGRYTAPAAAKSAAGRGNPVFTRAHNRANAVFLCAAQLHLSMVGRAGQPQGWPGSRVTGISTPVCLTTSRRGNLSGELTNLSHEAVIMTTILTQTQPEITIVDGHAVTTSIAVAEYFSKRHDDVLKKIRALDCSPEFHLRNFAEVVREVPGGDGAIRKMPAYQITRDGFAFLAMGFTGKKAAKFKEDYIEAFNRMERALQHPEASFSADFYRLELTFKNGQLISSRPLADNEMCATFDKFVNIASQNGYLVIHEDDLLKQFRAAAKGIPLK